MAIVALAGGTGAAKLLRGLAALLPPEDLTVVGNTGDDVEVWGLHVSPDLDTVTYALAGLLDEARGWGLRDDSFRTLEQMARLGEPSWFNLGDRDLATHLHRTRLLRAGRTLTEATAALAHALGVPHRLLPMSDGPVRTRVLTPRGWLGFQEYFVRDKAQPEVTAVLYAGAAGATPAPGVAEAIRRAGAVVVCPSNPITSVGPILAVPGVARALAETPATTIAVSPIVRGGPVSGPAGRLMAAWGLPVSPAGIARRYVPWLDMLVLDQQDLADAPAVEALGVTPVAAQTIMSGRAEEVALARRVLDALA